MAETKFRALQQGGKDTGVWACETCGSMVVLKGTHRDWHAAQQSPPEAES